jgi:predicted esterase
MRFWPFFLVLSGSALSACGQDDAPRSVDNDVDNDTADTEALDDVPVIDAATSDTDQPLDIDASQDDSSGPAPDGDSDIGADTEQPPPTPPSCDSLVEIACALPWPSSLYLKPDESRVTGFALAFAADSLPANRLGVHIRPDEFRRLDGYGPSTQIVVHFPGINLDGFPNEDDLTESISTNARSLLLEDTGSGLVAVPHWVELDSQSDDDARRVLFLRPGVILKEDTRYLVAFRNLTNEVGASIPRTAAFDALLDGSTDDNPELRDRQAGFDRVFEDLSTFGIDTDELNLAWDFHTGSSNGIHGPMIAIRDDALTRVGNEGPELQVTSVVQFTPEQDENIAFELKGTFEVPHYVSPDPDERSPTSWTLNIGDDGLPEASGTRTVKWWAMIPHSAIQSDTPHGLVLYGHGLLGDGNQVFSGFNRRISNTHNLIFFGGDMSGMAADDYANIIVIVSDLSNFHWLSDRLHQGLVEHIVMARTFRERFGALDIAVENGVTINPDELAYSGISQGGIFGASIVALSPDITRGHLGVPGNNYSYLLHRSVDFEPFFNLIRIHYPDPVDQAILLGSNQLLWDSADPVTYLRHLSAEPFAGNEPNSILLAPAKGDFQVAVTTNEIAARSGIGIALLENYDADRAPWGIEPQPYPHTGSGLVLYDYGNPWPAFNVNLPHQDDIGDPHSKPRQALWHDEQLVQFLRTGEITDVCGGDGCTPD